MSFMARQPKARQRLIKAAVLTLVLIAILGHFANDAAGSPPGIPGRGPSLPSNPSAHSSLLHGGYLLTIPVSNALSPALTLAVSELRISSRLTPLPPLTPPPTGQSTAQVLGQRI